MATPDIIVQVKGGSTSVITTPTGSATRLVQLADVSVAGLTDGQVLTYVAANGRYEFAVPSGAPAPDNYARPHSNGAFDHANGAFSQANTANTVAASSYNQANIATINADAAFTQANGAIYTAAQIRANISNTAPINYNVTTGVISHAASGASASGYGLANTVPLIVVDANGHITAVTNTSIAIDATQLTSGILTPTQGGTGQNTYANGDLLIGTSSGGLTRANLTQGYGILITNGNGSIRIESAFGKTYYFNYTNTADVVGYHTAPIVPSPNPENVVTTLCTTALAFNLVGSFITDVGEPDTTLLPAGTYLRHLYATTDGASNIARLRVNLYKRAANGQETLLRTNDSPDFSSLNPEVALLWTLTDSNGYTLDPTDRLVFKIYAARVSGGSGSVNVTIYFEGTNRASSTTTSILTPTGDTVARTHANAAFDKANGAVQTGFVTINVAGQTNVVATTNVSMLKLVGSGLNITTDAPNNTITLTSTASGGANVGSIQLFSESVLANSTAYLRADASNVSVNTYATLFGIIDRSYGSGDGSTTFTLPGVPPLLPTWVEGTALTNPNQLGTANTLSDGRLLIVGGHNASVGSVFANCVFGNIAGTVITWAEGTAFPTQRFNHASVQLPDGRMLVVAGRDQGGTVLDTTYFGNISGTTITWSAGTALPHSAAAHTLNVLPDGRVFVSGGFNGVLGVSANTYLGSIVGTTINWVQSTDLPSVKQYHTSTMLGDGRLLVMGGSDAGGTLLQTVHFGEVSGNTILWTSGSPLPVIMSNFVTLLLQHAAVLVLGGQGAGWNNAFVGSIYGRGIAWTQLCSLPLRQEQHTGVILSDNRILSIGGVNTLTGATSNSTYFATPMPWGIKF